MGLALEYITLVMPHRPWHELDKIKERVIEIMEELDKPKPTKIIMP